MATHSSDLDVDLEEVLQDIYTCTQLNISPSTFTGAPVGKRPPVGAETASAESSEPAEPALPVRPNKFEYVVATAPPALPVMPVPAAPVLADKVVSERASMQNAAMNLALEHLAVATLVQTVAQYQPFSSREESGLLLSDFGSLLPDELRGQVKNKLGGLRTLIARYPAVFDLRGEPGKEHVKLVGNAPSSVRRSSRDSQQSQATCNRRSSRDRGSCSSRHSSLESCTTRSMHGGRRSSRDSLASSRRSSRAGSGPSVPTLRLRGLPFSADAQDVVSFVTSAGVEGVQAEDVDLVRMRDGRTTGFATVVFSGEGGYERAQAAQAVLHMKSFGGRYVEAFLKLAAGRKATDSSMEVSTASPSDDSASFASSSDTEDITEERAVEELVAFIQAQSNSTVLLSMLGVAAGDATRSWMRENGLGLKQLLQKHTDVFRIEGEKGKQAVILAQEPIYCPDMGVSAVDGFLEDSVQWGQLESAFAAMGMEALPPTLPPTLPPALPPTLPPVAWEAPVGLPYPYPMFDASQFGFASFGALPCEGFVPFQAFSAGPAALGQGTTVSQIRLRGLPFTAHEDDVWDFLKQTDVNVQNFVAGKESIKIMKRRNGRATGQAEIELAAPMPWEFFRDHLHMRSMGERYIEVLEPDSEQS